MSDEEAVLRTIGARRSVRVFRPYLPIPDEHIVLLLEAARRASHFGNLGAVGAVVLRRGEHAALKHLTSSTGALALQSAPVVLLWTLDVSRFDDLEMRQHELVAQGAFGVSSDVATRRITKLILPFMQRRRDKIVESGLFELDAGQAIAQATIAARALGLGSCLCAITVSPKLREAVLMPDQIEIIIAQALGYPFESTNIPPRPRRAFSELFHLGEVGTPICTDSRVRERVDELYGVERDTPPWRNEELQLLQLALGAAGARL